MTVHETPNRALYTGTVPAALRVEWLSDRVRLRIETVGGNVPDAVVDLRGPDVDDLIETLTGRPERLR